MCGFCPPQIAGDIFGIYIYTYLCFKEHPLLSFLCVSETSKSGIGESNLLTIGHGRASGRSEGASPVGRAAASPGSAHAPCPSEVSRAAPPPCLNSSPTCHQPWGLGPQQGDVLEEVLTQREKYDLCRLT